MVRFSLFCKKGCHIEVARGSVLLMKIKIEPAIDESIISSQQIENSSWVLEIWIRFIRRRNISKLATRVMLCNDIDLPLFNRSKPWQKSNLNDLSVDLARKRITWFFFHITLFLYFFRNIICTSFYRFAIRVFLHGISF